MNTPLPAPTNATDPTTRAAERARHREVLNEMVELGADLARMVHRQAKVTHDYEVDTGVTVFPVPDRTVAFERVVRCVRRTIYLIERLDRPVAARAEDPAQDFARARVVRAIEDAIEQQAEGDAAERLREDLYERLDAPETCDLLAELAERPVEAVIAAIQRELGLVARRVGREAGVPIARRAMFAGGDVPVAGFDPVIEPVRRKKGLRIAAVPLGP